MARRPPYDPATEHEPLFDHAREDRGQAEGKRQRPAASVAWGKCPRCAAPKKTGLVPQGEHLVWRLHTKRTIGGLTMQCDASGVTLHDLPAKPLPQETPPVCPCQRGFHHA